MDKKNRRIIGISLIGLIIFMGGYSPLIKLLLPEIDPAMETLLRKGLQAGTILLFIFGLKLWNFVGPIIGGSKKGIAILTPLVLISFLPLFNGLKDNTLSAIGISFCITALIGITEELEYRGVLFGVLGGKGEIKAAIFSSIIFGLMHFLNLIKGADFLDTAVQVVFAFGFGLVLCIVRMETNSLLLPILIHWLWDFNARIAKTDFLPLVDTIHSIGLAFIVVWGLWLIYNRSRKQRKKIAVRTE